MNRKLVRAIQDVLPFDIDYEKGKLILQTIFDTIEKACQRNERVLVRQFGVFHRQVRPARWRGVGVLGKGKRILKPEKVYIRFVPCDGMVNDLNRNDEERNAQS